MLDTLAPGEHDGPAMKYKTLFRLLLKLLGVCFLVEGGSFSVVLGAAMAVSWLESGPLAFPTSRRTSASAIGLVSFHSAKYSPASPSVLAHAL